MKNVAFMKNSPLKYSIGNLLVSKELNDKLMLYKKKLGIHSTLELIRILLNSHPVLNNNEE